MKKIKTEVKEDFGYLPDKLSKYRYEKEKLRSILLSVRSLYTNKGISVVPIVDQINRLYNANVKRETRINSIDIWQIVHQGL